MLVMSRRENESVMIGHHHRVTVERIRGDAVRVRFAERFGRDMQRVLSDAATMRRDDCRPLGDDVRVTLVDVRGDKVRLGVTAPKDVSVHRQEVYDDITPDRSPWPEEDGG